MMDEREEDADEEAWLQLRPVEPLPSQCCGSGCSPCVFDLYHQELAKWEAARASKDRSLLSGEESQVREDCSSAKMGQGGSVSTLHPCGEDFPDSAWQRYSGSKPGPELAMGSAQVWMRFGHFTGERSVSHDIQRRLPGGGASEWNVKGGGLRLGRCEFEFLLRV